MSNRCLHCGLSCSTQFCCAGCAAVYTALSENGLLKFYELDDSQRLPARVGSGYNPQLAECSVPFAEMEQTTWRLTGVRCGSCAWLLQQLPNVFESVSDVEVEIASGTLRFVHSKTWEPQRIHEWLNQFGYAAYPPKDGEPAESVTPLALSWALAINVMMIAVAFYAGLDFTQEPELAAFCGAVSAVLALGSIFLGRSILWRALASIRHNSWNRWSIDVPISFGIAIAFVSSVVAVTNGDESGLWFDSISIIIAALLTSRWFNTETARRVRAAGEVDVESLPSVARRVVDEREIETRVEDLEIGDVLRVSAQETIPWDGRALQRVRVDRSMFSGESVAIQQPIGATIRAGERALNDVDIIVSSTSCAATALMPTQTVATSRTVAIADQFAGLFTIAVLIFAVCAVVVGWSDGTSLSRAVSVLLIACPCAAAMATPLSFAVAMHSARSSGVFF